MHTHRTGIEKANQRIYDSHTKIQYGGVRTSLMPETREEKNEKLKVLSRYDAISDTTHELTCISILKLLLTFFILSSLTVCLYHLVNHHQLNYYRDEV
jgi:hypothetical protein